MDQGPHSKYPETLRSNGTTNTVEPLPIDVWSDVVCPWCWIGKRRLERAIEAVGMTSAVAITYRSFELDASRGASRPTLEVLAQKFGGRPQDVLRRLAPVLAQGSELGLTFDFERSIVGRTFDAHRVIHGAAARGRGPLMFERLHQAYFAEAQDVSDHTTLRKLAVEVGLDEEEVADWLVSGAYAADVEADKAKAAAHGIRGVPFVVIGNRYAVEGAQPTELFAKALTRAHAELRPMTVLGGAGEVCEDDMCGVPSDRRDA